MELAKITALAGRHKRRKRLGRGPGSTDGKTCGRGSKGAGSRSGWSSRAPAEGGAMPFFRTIPKRGFSNFNFRTRYAIVNVGDLERVFEAGAKVDAAALAEVGLIRNAAAAVKVLGDGELTKKLSVSASRFSKQAAEKIQARGGAAQVVE